MKHQSRFIPGEELGQVARWQFSGVDAPSSLAKKHKPGTSVDEDCQAALLKQEGYAEGFVQGRMQAMLEAQQQIVEFVRVQGQESAGHLAGLIEAAKSQLESVEQAAAHGVLELACELSRQVLRHEVSINPQVLLPVIREALGELFADSRCTHIRLNPLDLALLQEPLDHEFQTMSLVILADPLIHRGGCLMESPTMTVDAQVEKRWARAVGQLGLDFPWEDHDAEP